MDYVHVGVLELLMGSQYPLGLITLLFYSVLVTSTVYNNDVILHNAIT